MGVYKEYPPLFIILWIVAGICSLVAILLSFYLIYKHLRNYTRPELQKFIIRILIMVPIYSTDSWLSLRFVNISIYFDLLRDCYEAFALYSFFCLIVSYVEKDYDVIELLHAKEPMSHPFPLQFLPKIRLGRRFLIHCRRFVLQFVFVKPLVAIISVILEILGYYGEGEFLPDNGYLWLTLIENISVGLSLYYLVLYYQAMKDELKPFKPFGKFLCIKSVIFFAFWQGIIISFLAYINVIQAGGGWTINNISSALQDFITCVEMLIVAVCHHFFFTYKEYRDYNKIPFLYDKKTKTFFNNPSGTITPIIKNFFTATSVSDVIADTKESFILPLMRPDDAANRMKEEEKILLEVTEEEQQINSSIII